MASRRTRIASSSLLCLRHDSPLSRSGRHRHRSFRCTLDTQRNLTGVAVSPVLEGRPAVISFVTVAELGYRARLAGWGPERLRRLEYEIARAEIVWPGPSLAEAYASLRTWCVRTGHGLGQKDCWTGTPQAVLFDGGVGAARLPPRSCWQTPDGPMEDHSRLARGAVWSARRALPGSRSPGISRRRERRIGAGQPDSPVSRSMEGSGGRDCV
jgi:hypothetical protein